MLHTLPLREVLANQLMSGMRTSDEVSAMRFAGFWPSAVPFTSFLDSVSPVVWTTPASNFWPFNPGGNPISFQPRMFRDQYIAETSAGNTSITINARNPDTLNVVGSWSGTIHSDSDWGFTTGNRAFVARSNWPSDYSYSYVDAWVVPQNFGANTINTSMGQSENTGEGSRAGMGSGSNFNFLNPSWPGEPSRGFLLASHIDSGGPGSAKPLLMQENGTSVNLRVSKNGMDYGFKNGPNNFIWDENGNIGYIATPNSGTQPSQAIAKHPSLGIVQYADPSTFPNVNWTHAFAPFGTAVVFIEDQSTLMRIWYQDALDPSKRGLIHTVNDGAASHQLGGGYATQKISLVEWGGNEIVFLRVGGTAGGSYSLDVCQITLGSSNGVPTVISFKRRRITTTMEYNWSYCMVCMNKRQRRIYCQNRVGGVATTQYFDIIM